MKLKIKGAFHPCLSLKSSAGAILLVVSAVIILLTLMQHTHGQGLAGAINGGVGGANNARLTPADQMLAKVTRIAGIVFFVVAILACVFASRLA
ncbi:MAG TPA: preprotein translocase subunit SecG [Faecalibacterium prausnitzii]|nr:preprotein translocase subunit SecG [Faecalibacterium prausnitzii]